jgi:hypothetical protein
VSADDIDPEVVADEALPLHNADPDRIVVAAGTIAELVRRLNHATFDPTTWRWPSQIDATVASLVAAAAGLQQLLRQLGAGLDRFARDERLYDSAPTVGGRAAASVADNAANHLVDAGVSAATLQLHLSRSHGYTARLGLRQDAQS